MVTLQTLYNDLKTLGLQMFQEKLVSGSNIKTINNNSILGSGNLSIGSGGGLSFDDIYPVGSIYISTNSTNPSTLFGGTWVQIEDRFLLAAGSNYNAGSTGGSADAVVVSHRHDMLGTKTEGLSSGNYLRAGYGSTSDSQYTAYAGESGTGKNMPPYLAVYVWKRVADVPSQLFYDDCTTDNTSQYSDVIKFTSTSASATLSFNSNSTDYSFVGSGGDYFVGRVIPNIRGEDNIRISVEIKLTNNSAYNQFFIGLSDNLSYSSGSSFTADMFRIRGDNKSDYLHNSGNEVSGSSSTTSVYNNWVIVVFERNGTSITGKIYNSSNTLIREYSYTTANSYTNPYYFIGLNARYSSSTKEINDIKVERM